MATVQFSSPSGSCIKPIQTFHEHTFVLGTSRNEDPSPDPLLSNRFNRRVSICTACVEAEELDDALAHVLNELLRYTFRLLVHP